MYLLIDAGNTRLKYACHDGRDWLARGILDDAASLANTLPAGFVAQRVVVASVASTATNADLQQALDQLSVPVEWLHATPERAGLHCRYTDPSRLGPDRWAAALGAWHTLRQDCLVVCAGTATTIEVIRTPGIYAGGCILPGLTMMLNSLATGTAALPRASTDVHADALLEIPTDTHHAIAAGCLHAQLGAIERLRRQLPAQAPVLLAGGNADQLARHLEGDCLLRPWLVMDGLLVIAQTTAATTGANS